MQILGIKKDEYSKVFLLFLYNLFLVMMFRMGRMINDTLIVSRLGADKLTFAYFGTSIAVAFTLFLYFRIADSFQRIKLFSVTAFISCISLLLARWALNLRMNWFYQFLYIWIEVFGTIMITQFYTLASDIFSTRDAKRLFGIIGTGGVIGSIIGGYIVRYLTKSIGIENFFYILAGSVFSCLVIINVIPRTINLTRLIPQPKAHFDYSILKSKHIRYISLATGIMLIVETLTDFQFNKLMGETFTGREIALLEFRGTFCLLLGIVSLFLQTFFTSRILLTFGLLAGLLILPGSILIGTVLILFGIYKLPIIFNQGADFTFRYTIDTSSRQLAIMPVKAEMRGRVKAFVEGLVKYLAQGLGALILILCIKIFKVPYLKLSYIAIIFLLLLIYYSFKLRKEYTKSVIAGIKEKRIDLDEIELKVTDPHTIKILEKALLDEEPSKVIYALDLLKELPAFNLTPHLVNLLRHRSPLVRARAVEILDDPRLIEFALCDKAPEVVACAIQSYCRILKKESAQKIKPFLENENLHIRAGAIFGLIKYAGYKLDPLIDLFNTYKLQALEIIGRLKLAQFAPQIIPCLGIKGLKASSFYALKEMGGSIYPELEACLIDHNLDESIRTVIPSIIDKAEILIKYISINEERIRDSVINALHNTGMHIELTDCLYRELENYYNTLYTLQKSALTKIQEYILRDKLTLYKDRIYKFLEISYPVKLITNIKKVKMDSIEALDNLLKRELKNLILTIIEGNPSLEEAEKYFKLRVMEPRGGIKEADMFPLVEEVLFLKGVPLFSQLATEEIAKIAKITEEKTFEKGTIIFNEGDPSDALYIIMRGKVNIIKDNKLIKTLGKGDCFGEVGMLDRGPRTAKAIILEDAVLSRLGSEEFYELLGDNPQISHGIFKILTEKLRESYEMV